MARKRRFNHRLVKMRRTYETAEVAQLFGIHVGTVHIWKKGGLQPVDDSRPMLFHGSEMIRFLKAKRQKNKIKLQPGEFRCSRCRQARKSLLQNLAIHPTGRQMGWVNQIMIRGLCEVCDAKMVLFTSQPKLSVWLSRFSQLPKELLGCDTPCINIGLKNERILKK